MNLQLLISILFSANLYALVDYTDPSESAVAPRRVTTRSVKQVKPTRRRQSTGKKYIQLNTTYTSYSYANNEKEGTVESVILDGKIETDYDLFLEFRAPFFSGKFKNQQLDQSYQSGNGEFLLGINWLEFGAAERALLFDILGGVRLDSSNEFGSSRTDKIIGINTQKRFFDFALGLGYELQMTGTGEDTEMDIGSIKTVKGQLGWMVSNDIQFVLSAAAVTISNSSAKGVSNRLLKEIRYGYVIPQIVLTIRPGVTLSMEGLFQTRRPKTDEIDSSLSLWSQRGLYGNSLSAGLGFSI